MEQDFKTSFIPKRPVAPQTPGETIASREKGSGLFMLISVVVFIIALISAGGAFAYKTYLSKNIEEAKVSLERAKNIFEVETINELQVLDKRINAAETILARHIAVSPIFDLLREITYPNIQYTKFDYTINPATGDVFVEMAGRSGGFDWVGVQADQFDANPNIKNPIFSNLVQDQFGRITFDLTFSVNKPFVTYGSPTNKTLQGQQIMNN